MYVGKRLKEERERLGYSQPMFAALVGATKNSQINWEKGTASPNANALATWAAHGVDVLYVLTAQRAAPVEETLTDYELSLLDTYRHAPSKQRRFIEDAVSMAALSVSGAMTA